MTIAAINMDNGLSDTPECATCSTQNLETYVFHLLDRGYVGAKSGSVEQVVKMLLAQAAEEWAHLEAPRALNIATKRSLSKVKPHARRAAASVCEDPCCPYRRGGGLADKLCCA